MFFPDFGLEEREIWIESLPDINHSASNQLVANNFFSTEIVTCYEMLSKIVVTTNKLQEFKIEVSSKYK